MDKHSPPTFMILYNAQVLKLGRVAESTGTQLLKALGAKVTKCPGCAWAGLC